MGRERLALEFERYTTWAVEAIEALQLDDPIPAACLATANPALFEYLSEASGAAESAPFLDVGCGPGGRAHGWPCASGVRSSASM